MPYDDIGYHMDDRMPWKIVGIPEYGRIARMDDSISPKGVEPLYSLRHAFCQNGTFSTLDGDHFVHAQPFFECLIYYTHF